MSANQYSQQPVRLQVSPSGGYPFDANTNTTPRMWRASDVVVQVAVFDAYNNPVDVGNLASMTLTLQPSPTSLTSSLTVTVPQANFSEDYCDWADWQAGLNQNVSFPLSAAQMDLSLQAQAYSNYWLIVQGLTATGTIITYCAGYVQIVNTSWALPTPTTRAGTFTLVAGAATVANTSIDSNSIVAMTLKTPGGTMAGAPYINTITPGTGFTVTGGGSLNTSTYNYLILV